MLAVHTTFLNLLLAGPRVTPEGSLTLARDIDSLKLLCDPGTQAHDKWSTLRLHVAVFLPPPESLLPVVLSLGESAESGRWRDECRHEVMRMVERRSDWRKGMGRARWATEVVRAVEGGREGGRSGGRERGSAVGGGRPVAAVGSSGEVSEEEEEEGVGRDVTATGRWGGGDAFRAFKEKAMGRGWYG